MALIDRTQLNYDAVRTLAAHGVITVPALHNPHAVEFRPILTLTDREADAIIAAVRTALG